MRELYYFIRDKEHKPVISVCLLLTTDGSPTIVGARGVAICSDRDTPCSKLHAHQSNGPGIARRRAWKAWKNGKNMYKVQRAEAVDVLLCVKEDNLNIWEDVFFDSMHEFKAFYHPLLSFKENRILVGASKPRGKVEGIPSE